MHIPHISLKQKEKNTKLIVLYWKDGMRSYKSLKKKSGHSFFEKKKTMGGSLTQVRALRRYRIDGQRPDYASEQGPGSDTQSSSSTAHHK
jgi:hypothetical protein